MRRQAMMVLLGLVAMDAAASTARAEGAVEVRREGGALTPVPDGGVYLGFGGSYLPDAGAPGLTGSLIIDRPLFWRFGLWVSGETSLLDRQPEASLALRLCFGVRADLVRSESRKVRLIGTVSFAHQHEAPLTVWRDHPFSSLLGESKDGLGHRSGLEVGAGLLLTPWIDDAGFARRVRVLMRLSGEWLPDGSGPNFYLAFLTSVGVAI